MSNAVENGIHVNDDTRGTTYFFSRSRSSASLWQRISLFLSIYWKSLIVVLTPLILLPIPILNPDDRAYRCMYVVLIMAIFWVLELLPLPVTSMLPIVLFPTMGILDSDKTCAAYMKETNMMFMGGLMIAAGVQHSKLPKRVALWTVQVVGCSHRRLNFGLTFVTMFISMWVSNAAATTMMVPIVEAILEVLEQQGLGDVYINRKKTALPENGKELKPAKETEEEAPIPSNITICYYLSIAYASTLGGCGTLVGTATNSAFKGIFDSEFPEYSSSVNFFWFMAYSTPPMLVMQLLVWLALQVTFMGLFRPNSEAAKTVAKASSGSTTTMKVIKEQYRNLGPITFHERSSGLLFIFAVFLYIFRKPGFMPGWADVMTTMKVKDGVTSMFIVILMFIIPMSMDFMKFFWSSSSYEELVASKPSTGIVTWAILKDKVPWGLLFLLGGGFALAEGSKATGLSSMIGSSLHGLDGLPHAVVLLVVVLVTQFITEFTSNVAIANLILPVLANMSRALDMDPRYLMVPATLACSMAFHMPVGTPPNAIVAGVAHIPTARMAVGGIGPKIITTLIVWGAYPTWGSYIFPPLDSEVTDKVANATALVANSTDLVTNATVLITNATALVANTTMKPLLMQDLALNCSIAIGSLTKNGRFRCNLSNDIGNSTALASVASGIFTCDYISKR